MHIKGSNKKILNYEQRATTAAAKKVIETNSR